MIVCSAFVTVVLSSYRLDLSVFSCAKVTGMFLVDDYLNVGSIHMASSEGNGSTRPVS